MEFKLSKTMSITQWSAWSGAIRALDAEYNSIRKALNFVTDETLKKLYKPGSWKFGKAVLFIGSHIYVFILESYSGNNQYSKKIYEILI